MEYQSKFIDIVLFLLYVWSTIILFSNSEQEKVKSHRQKISKWQSQVSERLQALNMRAGSVIVL